MKARLLALGAVSLALATPYAYAEDTVVVPDTVDSYVTEQPLGDATVIEGDVAVGTALPDTVVIKKVPDNDDFGYAIVNKKRVIVQPSTRKVVKVIE
jgi:hypothetical protein